MVRRADRIDGTLGAVIVLCRRNSALNVSETKIKKGYDFAVAASLQTFQNCVALFIPFYLLPSKSSYCMPFKFSSSCIADDVEKAIDCYPPEMFNESLNVRGDFRFPDSDWSTMYSTSKREVDILDYFNSFNLLPLITTGQTHRGLKSSWQYYHWYLLHYWWFYRR